MLWSELHDRGTEGSHQARVVRILLDHDVEVVVAGHMGQTIALDDMSLGMHLGGDRRCPGRRADRSNRTTLPLIGRARHDRSSRGFRQRCR